jgi:hypothetical protein
VHSPLTLLSFLPTQGLWDPLKIPDECEETHLNPYEFIYARYEFDDETQRTSPALIHLYKKWPRLQLSPDVSRTCCANCVKCSFAWLLVCLLVDGRRLLQRVRETRYVYSLSLL